MSKETTKGGAPGKDPGKAKPKRKLTREEKKQIAAIIMRAGRLSVPGDRLLRRSLASFLVMGRVCCWRQDWQGLSLMVGRTPS